MKFNFKRTVQCISALMAAAAVCLTLYILFQMYLDTGILHSRLYFWKYMWKHYKKTVMLDYLCLAAAFIGMKWSSKN